MTDDVATITGLRAKLAAVEKKQRAAEDTVDVVTRHTTLPEYLNLLQSICASQLQFDPESGLVRRSRKFC